MQIHYPTSEYPKIKPIKFTYNIPNGAMTSEPFIGLNETIKLQVACDSFLTVDTDGENVFTELKPQRASAGIQQLGTKVKQQHPTSKSLWQQSLR